MKTKIFAFAIVFLLSLSISAQLDRSIRPKQGPAPKINLGTPKMFTLKNGLHVLVVENHKLPRVSATLTIDNSPAIFGDKKGVDDLLGAMLGNGTTTISKDKFNEEVDFLGARISFWDSGASARSLSKYFERVLSLMADGVINPVFSQEEFANEKDKLLENLKNQDKDVKAIARRIQNIVAYGKNHPYGEFTSEKSLKNVALSDVTDYYNTYYKPNNAYLVVVGDISFKQAKKLIKKQFKNWKPADIPVVTLPKKAAVKKTTLYFVNMPNTVQSEVAIIETSNLNKKQPDYFDMLLANKILGGSATARLFMNLREDKGFTYGAYSRLQLRKYAPSRFSASASVRNAVTDSVVVEFMSEIKKIRSEKVSTTELKESIANYVGSFVMALEKPQTIAKYALNIQRENLPEDFYTTYLQKLNAVKVDGVQLAANRYLKFNREAIVIVGKASDVLPSLEQLHYPIVYLDKNGNTTKKPEINIPIPEGVTATSVINNYLKAIGGVDKVNAVKTVLTNYSATIQGMNLTLEVKSAAPNSVAVAMSMMGNVMSKQVFDGEKGYAEGRGQKMEIKGDDLESMKSDTKPFSEKGYLTTAKLLKIEPVNGENAYVLQVTKNKKAYYSVKTGLKLKEVETRKLPNGTDFEQAVNFADYKAVEGILLPHSMGMKMGPQTLDFKLNSVKFNEGVSAGDFK
ncbi:MAG: insulinase family protein [Flavobacteriaceae bacterium]|nr:insulinase family protein [Flavobacteriaceae bacterium]